MILNYPKYIPNYGNLTEKIMKEFILNYYHKQTLENKTITSLNASNDPTQCHYIFGNYIVY